MRAQVCQNLGMVTSALIDQLEITAGDNSPDNSRGEDDERKHRAIEGGDSSSVGDGGGRDNRWNHGACGYCSDIDCNVRTNENSGRGSGRSEPAYAGKEGSAATSTAIHMFKPAPAPAAPARAVLAGPGTETVDEAMEAVRVAPAAAAAAAAAAGLQASGSCFFSLVRDELGGYIGQEGPPFISLADRSCPTLFLGRLNCLRKFPRIFPGFVDDAPIFVDWGLFRHTAPTASSVKCRLYRLQRIGARPGLWATAPRFYNSHRDVFVFREKGERGRCNAVLYMTRGVGGKAT